MPDTPQKATDQEARFFLAIIRHQKNKPEIDWDAVAAEAGYSNGNTAQTRFAQIKRKLNMTTGNTSAKGTSVKGPKGGVVKASRNKSTGKSKSKATQLLDYDGMQDDAEPDDTKIPLNYKRFKVEDQVKKEEPFITVKKE